MSMWNDFKEFALKGNVIDLAVGVVIGAAFGAIVKSLVDNIIMPPIGLLVGGLDFSQLFVVLKAPPGGEALGTAADIAKAGGVVLAYGSFINALVSFFIVAASIFLLVRVIKKVADRNKPPPAKTTKECPECLSEIPVKATRCGHCTTKLAAAA